jgi:hypothetical protein
MISSLNRSAAWAAAALLALQRERVLVFAADAVALGHHVGGVDHGHVQLGLVLHQPGVHVGGQLLPAGCRDGFDTAGQHHVHALGHDAARRDGDGLQARGAKRVIVVPAIDSGSRRATRSGGPVAALETVGVAAAQNQVLDHFGIDARALHRGLDGEGSQLGAGVMLNSPRCDLVSGVRAVETMTASRMVCLLVV